MVGRSSRPLTSGLQSLSIRMLKDWDLLRVGNDEQFSMEDGTVITITLSNEPKTCVIDQDEVTLILTLESRPLGRGLVWYFRDPMSDALCTTIYFTEQITGSRKSVDALYSSQFQPKTYRKLLRMAKLAVAIGGDPDSNLAPGRGNRKAKNVKKLKELLGELVSNQGLLDEILDEYPETWMIPLTAIDALRKIDKLPRAWERFYRVHKNNTRWEKRLALLMKS
jgi:hypothetical protein